MRLIISPAKKMKVDTDSFPCHRLPAFLPQTQEILARLQTMSGQELKSLWKCSDKIALLNQQRLACMDLHRMLTPAILAYEGIQYQYMAPGVFNQEVLAYVEEHLRILSGFYGLLRPFDGVTPYRLEMQAKLAVSGAKDLYAYWGDTLAKALSRETRVIVNLASKEYSRCIAAYLPPEVTLITCIFGEVKDGTVVEKGTLCKMARGEMVRYLAQVQGKTPEQMKAFDRLGYQFRPDRSDEITYVLCKEDKANFGSWNESA